MLLGIGALLLSQAFDSPVRIQALGGNLPINSGADDPLDISSHNSPSIARDPTEPANLAVADRIDSPVFSCALHISSDGGATWTQTPIPAPSDPKAKCFAPDVAFSSDGTLYYSFVTLKGLGNVPDVFWVASSEDGGRTLSAPKRISGPLAFQTRLLSDPRVPDRLFAVWLQAEATATLAFPETGYPIVFTRSDDGGDSWSEPVEISGSERLRVVAPVPAIREDGTLFVTYLDLGDDALDYAGGHGGRGGPPYPGSWSLVLTRSRDGGATWSQTEVDNAVVPTARFVVFLPPQPSIAVGPEDVYITFHDGRLGDPDVWLWRSEDDGSSWEEPLRVNDTGSGDGITQNLPRASLAPDGRLDIIYYDRRGDPDDVRNEVWMQSSLDGGKTFSEGVRLSDESFDSRIGPGVELGMPDLGSRLALLSTEDRALAAWTDTRAGSVASLKQDIVRSVVAFAYPFRLPSWVEWMLSFVGGALVLLGLVVVVAAGRKTSPGAAGERLPA